ncbi:MAG TPA: MerR family transcriptional regulator [Thermomicrobiales bacterium]
MAATTYLRTSDLAREVQISVQQVRNYEAGGFIPPVERSPSGYRRYTPQHLAALKTAKQLIGGYGWPRTRQIMQALHQGQRGEALALIDARHAELAETRQQLAQTLAALSLLTAQLPIATHPRAMQRLRVGAAARLVGVRVSALRFWDQQGLLQPVRDDESKYRLYDEQQLRRLRIVVLLRQANYDFPAIHTTLNELEAGQPERAVAAVEQRRSDLAATSWRCIAALATLHGYVEEFLGGEGAVE